MAPHYSTTYNSNIVALPSIHTASKDPRILFATGYTANMVSTENTPVKGADAELKSMPKTFVSEDAVAAGRVELGKLSNVQHVRAGYVANLAGNRAIPQFSNKLVASQHVVMARKSQPTDAENCGTGPAPFSTTTHTHFPLPHVIPAVEKQAQARGVGVGEVAHRALPGVVSGFTRNMLPPLDSSQASVSTSNQDSFKPPDTEQAVRLAPGGVVKRLAEPNARGQEAVPESHDSQPLVDVHPKVLQRLRRHHPLEFDFLNKPNSVGVSIAHSQCRPVERRVLQRIVFDHQNPTTTPFGGVGDNTVLGVDASGFLSVTHGAHVKLPLQPTRLDNKLEPKLVLESAFSRSTATGRLGGEVGL